MKALMKTAKGEGHVSVCEAARPHLNAGEVLIRVEAVGVCGTDIKIWQGTTWSNPPVILGHEYSGVIAEVAGDVTRFHPGDRVVSETAQVVCGSCEYCRGGRELMCDQRLSIGYGVDGAMAEYIKVRQAIVHKIPDSLSFDEAALCEPLSVAVHGLSDHAAVTAASDVLVMGPGAIGQLVAQVAKSSGARVVLVGLPKDQERLDAARAAGVDLTFAGVSDEKLRALTGGRGFDIAVDCTGAEPAIRQAMRAVRKTGSFIQIGLTKPELTIDYSLLTEREIRIIGSFGHQAHDWESAIRLLDSKKVNVEHLITGRYSLDEWESAFSDMRDGRGIKILIYPNGK